MITYLGSYIEATRQRPRDWEYLSWWVHRAPKQPTGAANPFIPRRTGPRLYVVETLCQTHTPTATRANRFTLQATGHAGRIHLFPLFSKTRHWQGTLDVASGRPYHHARPRNPLGSVLDHRTNWGSKMPQWTKSGDSRPRETFPPSRLKRRTHQGPALGLKSARTSLVLEQPGSI